MYRPKGYQKYNVSADQLHQLYIIDGLSTVQVAKKLGIPEKGTVNDYLRKYKIPIRSRRDAAIMTQQGTLDFIPITDKEKEIIKGELLGDGHVNSDPKSNDGYCVYKHSSKHKEYLEWLMTQLPSLKFGNIGRVVHSSGAVSYHLHSNVHPDLTEFRDLFYLEDDTKIIPKDIKLTPTVLHHWYLGDGTYGYVSAGRKPNGDQKKSWQMSIAACDFSRDSLEEIIIPQLHDIGIKATVITKKGHPHVRISSYTHDRFFEYISKCNVKVYDYKFSQDAYIKWKETKI
ncbi:MAG TPA: hypothetical protein VD757_00425 [Candidatus Nitrosocosmicus sp.]|nr:hypothetical protein [Candidatus Nitrosocosmicus sp.]